MKSVEIWEVINSFHSIFIQSLFLLLDDCQALTKIPLKCICMPWHCKARMMKPYHRRETGNPIHLRTFVFLSEEMKAYASEKCVARPTRSGTNPAKMTTAWKILI